MLPDVRCVFLPLLLYWLMFSSHQTLLMELHEPAWTNIKVCYYTFTTTQPPNQQSQFCYYTNSTNVMVSYFKKNQVENNETSVINM